MVQLGALEIVSSGPVQPDHTSWCGQHDHHRCLVRLRFTFVISMPLLLIKLQNLFCFPQALNACAAHDYELCAVELYW